MNCWNEKLLKKDGLVGLSMSFELLYDCMQYLILVLNDYIGMERIMLHYVWSKVLIGVKLQFDSVTYYHIRFILILHKNVYLL